jgi:xanthine dehydrogenase YagR molybdenum-binding subunit
MTDELRDRLGGAAERIDGVAKVTGAARYASDEPVASPAFGYMLVSQIARGSINTIDLTEARAVPGVIDIVTHENVGSGFKTAKGPDGGPTTTTLESDRIWHDGQLIGLVVAESLEAAPRGGKQSQDLLRRRDTIGNLRCAGNRDRASQTRTRRRP